MSAADVGAVLWLVAGFGMVVVWILEARRLRSFFRTLDQLERDVAERAGRVGPGRCDCGLYMMHPSGRMTIDGVTHTRGDGCARL